MIISFVVNNMKRFTMTKFFPILSIDNCWFIDDYVPNSNNFQRTEIC